MNVLVTLLSIAHLEKAGVQAGVRVRVCVQRVADGESQSSCDVLQLVVGLRADLAVPEQLEEDLRFLCDE